MCLISYFFSLCNKTSDKEQLKEWLAYSSSQFEETVYGGRLCGLNENGSYWLVYLKIRRYDIVEGVALLEDLCHWGWA